MGRYNVGNKQSIEGIATLTNNPIALDNIRAEINKVKRQALELTDIPITLKE